MQNVKITTFCLLLAAAIGLSLCIAGCDKPVEPKPLTDYPVYFCDPEGTPELFTYHPLTQQVDSIEIPWRPREGITVSADGKHLYLALRTSVVVVETDSLSVIAELQYEPDRPVAVSPDNQLVAITGDDLYILRTCDYAVVFSDTDRTENGYFSSDSRSFYCAAGWSSDSRGVVYKVDLTDSLFPVTRRPFAEGGVVHVIPSMDESKWFLYLTVQTWISVFEVYDVFKDSIIFREGLTPGYGHIAISPDGKYAVYTNPGRSATDPPAPPAFTVFDIESNAIDTVVSDIDFFSDSTWVAHPNWLAITPDSQWLAILGGSLALRVLYLYDIQKGQLVHREDWGGSGHTFTNLSVQNAR